MGNCGKGEVGEAWVGVFKFGAWARVRVWRKGSFWVYDLRKKMVEHVGEKKRKMDGEEENINDVNV